MIDWEKEDKHTERMQYIVTAIVLSSVFWFPLTMTVLKANQLVKLENKCLHQGGELLQQPSTRCLCIKDG